MTELEAALKDTLQDVRRGDVASGAAMLADVHAGLAVHGLSKRERRLWQRLVRLVEKNGGKARAPVLAKPGRLP